MPHHDRLHMSMVVERLCSKHLSKVCLLSDSEALPAEVMSLIRDITSAGNAPYPLRHKQPIYLFRNGSSPLERINAETSILQFSLLDALFDFSGDNDDNDDNDDDDSEVITTDVSGLLRNPKVSIVCSMSKVAARCLMRAEIHILRGLSRFDLAEPYAEDVFEMALSRRLEYEVHHGVEYAPGAIMNLCHESFWKPYEKHGWATEWIIPDVVFDCLDSLGAHVAVEGRAASVRGYVKISAEKASIFMIHLVDPYAKIDPAKVRVIERLLRKRIVAQNEAIIAIASSARRYLSKIRDTKKPIGSFFFCGPTGVGKTEIAKATAEILHGGDDRMIRFDMSEFQERHTLSRLLGAPPGYVGYGDEPQLTTAVLKKPDALVLFDEFEKANRDLVTILLQCLEDARLTDMRGNIASFADTFIMMTSNAAAEVVRKVSRRYIRRLYRVSKVALTRVRALRHTKVARAVTYVTRLSQKFPQKIGPLHVSGGMSSLAGWSIHPVLNHVLVNQHRAPQYKRLFRGYRRSFTKKRALASALAQFVLFHTRAARVNTVASALEEMADVAGRARKKEAVMRGLIMYGMRPEFLNRVDYIIPFDALGQQSIKTLFDLRLARTMKYVKKLHGFKLRISAYVRDKVLRDGHSKFYGARALRRAMTATIEDPLAAKILLYPRLKIRYASLNRGLGGHVKCRVE